MSIATGGGEGAGPGRGELLHVCAGPASSWEREVGLWACVHFFCLLAAPA